VAWRNELYDALIKHTGLKGNRSQPKAEGSYYVLKNSKMPAVLLELGFMDSRTDVPVILTDAYAQNCAKAIVEVLVKRGKLTKKATPSPITTLYKVQVGAFSNVENAEKLVADLKANGFPAYVVKA
jgi:N-acetylmuramoyl-L-alanine amidase